MQADQVNKAALISKGIQIAIPVAAIGVSALVIHKMIKKGKNADGTTSRFAPSLKDTIIQSEKLTITPSDAALLANTLYGGMLGLGTKVELIYNAFKSIKTRDDMLLVIKAFGMKQYLWFGRAAILGQDYNLLGWLDFELKDRQKAKLRPKFESWGLPL